MIPTGRAFYKMSGSGNDFVFVDARNEAPGRLEQPDVVQSICARGTGVGADGIVFLEPSSRAAVKLVYLNADGSRADFCGNATLCTARLAHELGIGAGEAMTVETDAGVLAVRIDGGLPEIDLPPVSDVRAEARNVRAEPGESRIGFTLAGVPHIVIRCGDVSTVDLVGRARPIRSHSSLMPAGANVNFVSRGSSRRWRYRTYERGVEGETLACGSGAVAIAILLTTWGDVSGPVELETRSGKVLRVRLSRDGEDWLPSLSGEGRVVYQGKLSEI